MGRMTDLKSADGFEFGCYHADPQGARKGGLVLIQEIFGVTEHIREVCDGYAAEGLEVLAPSLFDRKERGFTTDYDEAGIAKGREYAGSVDWDLLTADVQACVNELSPRGPVFIVGYCFGGTVVWVASSRVKGLAAGSGYYGRLIVDFLDEAPQCPVELHFGETDHTIPMENVEKIKAAHPDVPVHVYPAGHGFNSDRRADYHAESAGLAWERTLALFRANGMG